MLADAASVIPKEIFGECAPFMVHMYQTRFTLVR
jgi:hypothetical protein